MAFEEGLQHSGSNSIRNNNSNNVLTKIFKEDKTLVQEISMTFYRS